MPTVNSVTKAMDILEIFTSDGPWLSLGDIAARLGFPRSTAHALLSTLAARGYIEKSPEGRYALGTAVIPLTQAVRVNVELRDRAAPLLRELATESKESVYLTVLDGDLVLYIYAIETPQRLLARTAVGDRVAPHCVAVGKAMLSVLPEARVREIVSRSGMAQYTPNTITDLGNLLQELEATRRRGYALDNQEHEDHTCCVAAPILGPQGTLVGACSVSGGTDLCIGEASNRVVDTALQISRLMGYIASRGRAASMTLAVTSEGGSQDGTA